MSYLHELAERLQLASGRAQAHCEECGADMGKMGAHLSTCNAFREQLRAMQGRPPMQANAGMQNTPSIERRSAEWAVVRADIDRVLKYVDDPGWRAAMINAYHAGYKRGAAI